MYTNQPVCTVFEKTVDTVKRMERYIPHEFAPVYWQPSSGQKGGKVREDDSSFLCMIPGSSVGDYLPKKGDLITLGEASEISRNCFTIANVKDLRYGSADVQHVEVTAS